MAFFESRGISPWLKYLENIDMMVRVFTIQFNAMQGGFNDEPLRDFVKAKEVLSFLGYKAPSQFELLKRAS